MNETNGYAGTISPAGIYVRALYDFDADDTISISFRQGDIIQVLTQLESGWWDGMVRGHRGWFPSNYCEFVDSTTGEQLDHSFGPQSDLEESDAEYDEGTGNNSENEFPPQANGTAQNTADTDQEEAALFWIPQATPDGRLFYFNTLTGVSTMELPLENPTIADSDAQRPASKTHPRDSSRPPPESLAGGFEREDDTDYEASDAEDKAKDRSSQLTAKQRKSYMSDGASPSASMDSLSLRSPNVAKHESKNSFSRPARTSSRAALAGTMPRQFVDDALSIPLTWAGLVEDMRRAVERYRAVVDNQQKSDIVRRVEDISDYLRLLLAAASGTTDQHSGLPSIIASNKALYPQFRNMMARFSKLVLSSHMAAADFSNNDSLGKCMQEADGMLKGVFSFVEVARQQRGEDIPRLTPGFISGAQNGGSWQNNGLAGKNSRGTAFTDEDAFDAAIEPSVRLQPHVIERMSELRRMIVSSLRRLEEKLVLRDKIISAQRHRKLSDELCMACGKAVEHFRPFFATMESVNLSETGVTPQDPKCFEFATHKQRVYTCIAELILSAQAVAAPLGDEWESHRGDTLEDRLERVRAVSRSLERATFQVQDTLQSFITGASAPSSQPVVASNGYLNGSTNYSQTTKKESVTNFSHHKAPSSVGSSTIVPSVISPSASSRVSIQAPASTIPSDAEGMLLNAGSSKANKFFGEAPVIRYADMPSAALEDMPAFLGLDYEGEIQYDTKTDPPSIKGGTLLGLVEQLTRHDKFDSLFKSSFLLTYQSFTSANELFEVLIRRWSIQPPPGLSQDDIRMWMEKKQAPIRLRIVNVLKQWVELYWMEGNDNASHELISRMYSFAKDTVAQSNTPGWKPLLNVIEQRSRGEDTSAKKLVQTPTIQTPLPILPKNMKKLKFTDIDPTEFARQLTIIESRLYAKIKPHECLNKIWQKRPPAENGVQAEPAANVKALILHSNRLTNFVAEMILNQGDLAKRASIVKHFVAVADKCLALNNFSTLTAIISALGTAPIHRLARTWNKIGKSTAATLEKMRKLMHSTKNFAPYRQALHQANPPCIPFFGVYLTDLTFIEDGMASVIRKTDLINFAKRAKTAEVIREIQTYQNVGYPFKAVPELQDYILSMLQSAGDVHEMYDQSLKVEPREREDEKIARLVSSSFGVASEKS